MDETKVKVETRAHIRNVAHFITDIVINLGQRAATHDASKLKDPELQTFVEVTPKLKNSTYGSEEYHGFLKAMKPALDHHYACNRHHPEHFSNGINGMNIVDMVEMLCDWKAATLRHADGDIVKSINYNAQRFGITDQLRDILLNSVDLLVYNPERVTTQTKGERV